MHIPDGVLSVPVSVACAVLSAAAVGAGAARSRASLGPRAAASVGVVAAFVFAAQMLNFPVAGGTSGHFVGGVLVAVLAGPAMAMVVMTAVLALQCLIFGDGGLLSLGANVLNMAVVHCLVGFAVFRAIAGARRRPRGAAHDPRSPPGANGARVVAAIAFASWVATVAAAATCAGELALSRIAAPGVVLSAVVGAHLVVGVGEAVVSALVLATLIRLRPAALAAPERPMAPLVVPGLVAVSAIALFVSPFACTWPDALERAVARLGVSPSAARVAAPLREYAVPGLGGGPRATALAALAGTLLVFAACVALGLWLSPPRAQVRRDLPPAPRS
jgi:cobalt/nickel transport system permease protein